MWLITLTMVLFLGGAPAAWAPSGSAWAPSGSAWPQAQGLLIVPLTPMSAQKFMERPEEPQVIPRLLISSPSWCLGAKSSGHNRSFSCLSLWAHEALLETWVCRQLSCSCRDRPGLLPLYTGPEGDGPNSPLPCLKSCLSYGMLLVTAPSSTVVMARISLLVQGWDFQGGRSRWSL